MSGSGHASSGVSRLLPLPMGVWRFTGNLSPEGSAESEGDFPRGLAWVPAALWCLCHQGKLLEGQVVPVLFMFFLHLETMSLHMIAPCYLKYCSVFSV